MAKARMLSTKAGSDPDLNSMSIEAELVFLLTIPHLDRDGLIGGDPIPLWGKVVPRRVELMDKMPRIIQEWVEHNLVVRYEWKDGAILFFKGFRKHNIHMTYEREPISEFPPPPGFHHSAQGLIPDDPEQAGRLAETLGERSKYHVALTEAAKQAGKEVDISLHVNYMQSTCNLHAEDQDQHQSEVEVEDENTTTRALVDFALTLAEGVNGWNGASAFVQKTAGGGGDLLCLISWLWLYEGMNQSDPVEQWHFSSCYKSKPFAGIDNVVGYIIRQVERRIMPTLYPMHKKQLQDDLAAVIP